MAANVKVCIAVTVIGRFHPVKCDMLDLCSRSFSC